MTPDIAYWRGRGLALGNERVWWSVIDRYNQPGLNPHLSLAHLASGKLSVEQLKEIHERLEAVNGFEKYGD